ncbi:MAG: hypothetical protein AAB583_04725 [Patescibacteria group bacterium]
MNKEDIELAKQEFNRDRDLWTSLLLQRRFYYTDLLTRVTDRQINHILTLTTITVAVLSLVFPLVTKTSPLSIFSFSFLSISTILGTALVLYTIFHDKSGIPKRRDEELSVYSKFQSGANQNFSKAYSGDLIWDDVKKYFNLRNEIIKEIENKRENKIVPIIIDASYISFLLFFFLGLGSFLISFLNKPS